MSVDFNKVLGDVSLRDLYKMLNNKVHSLEDRMSVADKICECDFFRIYFDDVYNPHINRNEDLSIENNVCVFLERVADYILLSEEEKNNKNQNETFYFTRRDRLMKRLERELNFSSIFTNNSDLNDSILHNLEKQDRGYIELKEVEVNKSDLKRKDELGDILRSYEYAIRKVDNDESINNIEKQKHKYLLAEDMKTAKKYYLGISDYVRRCEVDHISPDEFSVSNLELFLNNDVLEGVSIDLGSGRSIKLDGLLYLPYRGLDENDPLSFWVYELNNTISKAGLTDREHEILNMIRIGKTQPEIAEELGVTQQYISKVYRNTLKKIINKQEECNNANE